LFNRQPTLHRMSMMAHIARIMTRGDTFRMNVADGFALATGSVKSV
jgi:DNA-directed RNA polymerase beta' subunit